MENSTLNVIDSVHGHREDELTQSEFFGGRHVSRLPQVFASAVPAMEPGGEGS